MHVLVTARTELSCPPPPIQDPWNLYDWVVVIAMCLGPGLGFQRGTGVARALRFGRVVKLLRSFLKGLSRLIDVLMNSLAAMANITALLSLVLFVYAILGMQFFGTTKTGPALNITSNFETFPQAIMTLFQIVCGEAWLNLMHEASVGVPFCTEAQTPEGVGDCGAPLMGPVYFFSFFILTFAVFLNLYVASILDTYSSSTVAPEDASAADPQQQKKFMEVRDRAAPRRTPSPTHNSPHFCPVPAPGLEPPR